MKRSVISSENGGRERAVPLEPFSLLGVGSYKQSITLECTVLRKLSAV